MQILKQHIRVPMAKAFRTPQEQYNTPTQPETLPETQDWLSILESVDETTWGAWQVHDPETAQRVEKIRALWNSTPTSFNETESSAAATFLGPLGSPDTLLKIFDVVGEGGSNDPNAPNPDDPPTPVPAELMCKVCALVDTVVDYKSLFCFFAYVEDPNADPAKSIESLEHLLQHLNIDECIKIMHHYVILNPSVVKDPQRTELLGIRPKVRRIVKAILVAGSKPPVTQSNQPTNQPSNSANNCLALSQTTPWSVGGYVAFGIVTLLSVLVAVVLCINCRRRQR